MAASENIRSLVEQLPPITLDEMKSIRLMKRTDTKFVTNIDTLARLLQMCQGHYYAQRVNDDPISPYTTLYFDDSARHEMFHRHQAGHRPRMKVRARTYINGGVSFLEIKKKDNHGKTRKKRIQVPSIEAVMDDRFGEDFLTEQTGYTWNDICPTVRNFFNRITLVNFEKTERLTIDFDLRFFNYETQLEETMGEAVIIELKRDGRVPSPILPLLRELRIHQNGFSKYCIGTVITNPHVRVNNFKMKLHDIRKIVNK
ncbi:MAG: polyphosphate polymerase domain-containing protein [Bacteroidales bacterium]|nr:polyphosphate polymerase domain-containing protein [Bacteroidales bacterium]